MHHLNLVKSEKMIACILKAKTLKHPRDQHIQININNLNKRIRISNYIGLGQRLDYQ